MGFLLASPRTSTCSGSANRRGRGAPRGCRRLCGGCVRAPRRYALLLWLCGIQWVRLACLCPFRCRLSRNLGPVTCSIGQDWRGQTFFAYDCPARCARRIRLVAYGARLESVLGASPRGFESPILRHRTPGPLQVPGFLLPVAPLVFQAPLVFRAPSGPAAREIATREPAARSGRSRSPPVPSGPSGALHTGGTCGAVQVPQAPPPPTGTAARPSAAHRHRGQAMQSSPPSLGVLWWPANGR